MGEQSTLLVSQAVGYIEENLDHKLGLDQVAEALYYSKFYLHRTFRKTAGLTLHAYIQRRKLTEAAKLLVFSEMPILDIALLCGYESQQAFTEIFKAIYKRTPAKFRSAGMFYPLQLEFCIHQEREKKKYTKEDINFAAISDIKAWMELVRLTVDGYPCMDERSYLNSLQYYISHQRALLLREGNTVIGGMCYSPEKGGIDFWAVHPQYRGRGIEEIFLSRLTEELSGEREISLTTYRAGDQADTGYRETYFRLGFVERELLVEYGYPTQRLVLSSKNREETRNGTNAK